jgi:dynein heavy chain
MIKKFEEELKIFTTELKKRDFYFYKTGVDDSKKKLEHVNIEIADFDQKLIDYGYNANKFGNPDLIITSSKQVEGIKIEIQSMMALWDHIDVCQNMFSKYMEAKWIDTNPFDMEEEVKNVFKFLKEMRVDKKCNAYIGI